MVGKYRASLALGLAGLAGCGAFPVVGSFDGRVRAEGHVATTVNGTLEVKVPSVPEPGPLSEVVVRPSPIGPGGPRVAILDVDGLILNQNFTGVYASGDNPVALFREKLHAAGCDPRVRAAVLRINSPGGGVTASDILAEDLARFRKETGKPVVACLMDLGAGGAYYLAVGADRVVAHPTTVTGGVGVILNLYNLEDAMAALNIRADPVKAGDRVDMGSITSRLPDDSRALLQEMADGFRDRFRDRVARKRPGMTSEDRQAIDDGRVVPATKALALHMVDRLGYLDDALDEAQSLAHLANAEVVQYQRPGTPAKSVYAVAPNMPIQGEIVPLSYPGLDRGKTPTFLYLWQPDPTILRQAGRCAALPPIVLVTGAGGFVGGHIARHLAASGQYRVRALARRPAKTEPGDPEIEWRIGDLRDPIARSKAVDRARFVIHTASWVRLGADPKGLSRAINVEGTRSLIDAARSSGVERFVYTSTLQTLACGTPDRPADEDSEWNLDPVRSPYTESKREAEALVLDSNDARMATIAICPGMVIGPRDVGPTSTRVLLAMSRAPVVTLPDGGIPVIDAVTLAIAHERALTGGEPGSRYAAIGPYLSFRDQAEIVRSISGRPFHILRIPDLALAPMSSIAGWIDRAARGRWLAVSRATVAGGFLRFHVDGSRADRAFGLIHPRPETSIFEALEFSRRSGLAPWLRDHALSPMSDQEPGRACEARYPRHGDGVPHTPYEDSADV